jgi:hypothetical protein
MESPIMRMQRASYQPAAGRIFLRGFGDLTQGITGVKAGVQAGTLSTSIGTGAATLLGAAGAGSVVPIVGTAIGVIVALVASGVFSHRMDPEVGNFNNAMALVRAQGPQAVLGIQDKYLVLAGLFDLEPHQIKGNIPIYKKYGRMGEQRFVMDMCALIQSAANQGIITANDTVQSVYDKVVAPWIAGFGFGPMQDSNTELITTLLLGLIGEYVSGQYKQRWYAVGGQFAFASLPAFALPQASAVAPTASGTPVPTTAPIPVGAPAQPVQVLQPGPVTAPTPVGSAVPVPSGFNVSAQAYPSGQPIYNGPDGLAYTWDGVRMSPFTGTILTGGGMVSIANGIPQGNSPGTTSGGFLQSNTQAGLAPSMGVSPYAAPQSGTGYIPYAPPSTPLPTPAGGTSPITAGMGSGLPSWLSWGAVAGVVGLMLITARPVGGKFKVSRRRR